MLACFRILGGRYMLTFGNFGKFGLGNIVIAEIWQKGTVILESGKLVRYLEPDNFHQVETHVPHWVTKLLL